MPNPIKTTLYMALASVFLVPCHGEKPQLRTYTVLGSFSCKDWNAVRTRALHPKSEFDNFADSRDLTWILGYLSGMNKETTAEKNVLAGVDYRVVQEWTDKFCGHHPERGGSDAAAALFERLSH